MFSKRSFKKFKSLILGIPLHLDSNSVCQRETWRESRVAKQDSLKTCQSRSQVIHKKSRKFPDFNPNKMTQ